MRRLLLMFSGLIAVIAFSLVGFQLPVAAATEYDEYCYYGGSFVECACGPRVDGEYLCELTNFHNQPCWNVGEGECVLTTGSVHPCTLDGEGQVAFECKNNTAPRHLDVYYDGTDTADFATLSWSPPACTYNVSPTPPCAPQEYHARAYVQGCHCGIDSQDFPTGTSVVLGGLTGGQTYDFDVAVITPYQSSYTPHWSGVLIG